MANWGPNFDNGRISQATFKIIVIENSFVVERRLVVSTSILGTISFLAFKGRSNMICKVFFTRRFWMLV